MDLNVVFSSEDQYGYQKEMETQIELQVGRRERTLGCKAEIQYEVGDL